MSLENSFNMEDLAKVYEQILSDKHFNVDVYSNLSNNDNYVQGIMKPYRRPFKLKNIKAETVELTFEFFIKITKKQDKLDELKTISKICGYLTKEFASNGKNYKIHSFLDFANPPSSPVIGMGEFTQCIVVTGTCLVSEPSGALVSNELKTEITFNKGLENQINGFVEVLAHGFGPTTTPESTHMLNNDIASSYNKNQVYTFTYSILVLKNKVCERLVKAARQIQPLKLNESIFVKDYFPAFDNEPFEIENECIAVGCSFSGVAGAFATIELVLHNKLNLED